MADITATLGPPQWIVPFSAKTDIHELEFGYSAYLIYSEAGVVVLAYSATSNTPGGDRDDFRTDGKNYVTIFGDMTLGEITCYPVAPGLGPADILLSLGHPLDNLSAPLVVNDWSGYGEHSMNRVGDYFLVD